VRKITREEMFSVCAQCHARRSELAGDFRPGEDFFDHHQLTIPDETDIFYPDGQVRYRLRDRIDGATLGSPTASLPAATWRRVEVRIRLLPGANNDECEFRLDGATVAAATGLDLGDGPLEEAFLSNRQAAFSPPPTPGDWVATYDDVAFTVNQFPGPGRVIARQGRAGTPTYGQFTLVGAASIDAAWSQTPASAAARAESPNTGDPLAQTMLVAPFDAGLNPMTPTSVIGACQTWIDANTSAAPDRTYAVRRRLGGADTDTELAGIDTAARPLSDALLGGFWSSTLAGLNAAEIGAAKSGGAGGAALVANDLWLICEYAPPDGDAACGQVVTSTTTTTVSVTSTSSSISTSSTSSSTSTSTSSSTSTTVGACGGTFPTCNGTCPLGLTCTSLVVACLCL